MIPPFWVLDAVEEGPLLALSVGHEPVVKVSSRPPRLGAAVVPAARLVQGPVLLEDLNEEDCEGVDRL